MSISIPQGFRVPEGTDLFELQQRVSTLLADTVSSAYADFMAREVVALYDFSQHFPDYAEKALAMHIYHKRLTHRKTPISGSLLIHELGSGYRLGGHEDGLWAPVVSLCIYGSKPGDGYAYGNLVVKLPREMITGQEIYDLLADKGLIEEYRYWNANDDLGGEIGYDEFEKRGEIWRVVLNKHSLDLMMSSAMYPVSTPVHMSGNVVGRIPTLTTLQRGNRMSEIMHSFYFPWEESSVKPPNGEEISKMLEPVTAEDVQQSKFTCHY